MNRIELLYGYQKTESVLKVYADMHHVNQNTMTRWIRQFLLHGLAGVRHQTLTELKDLVKQGVEYFNKVEISSKRNNLTAEDFRNEAV